MKSNPIFDLRHHARHGAPKCGLVHSKVRSSRSARYNTIPIERRPVVRAMKTAVGLLPINASASMCARALYGNVGARSNTCHHDAIRTHVSTNGLQGCIRWLQNSLRFMIGL